MTIEEMRLTKMLQKFGHSLNEVTKAHNALFTETGENTRLFWAKLGVAEGAIKQLQEDITPLIYSLTSVKQRSTDQAEVISDLGNRVGEMEECIKVLSRDLKEIKKELLSYQKGCGLTIREMQMRIENLEAK